MIKKQSLLRKSQKKVSSLLILFLSLCIISSGLLYNEDDSSLPGSAEISFLKSLQEWEYEKTDFSDSPDGAYTQIRSQHIIFGMPQLIDNRHNFIPNGLSVVQPGISIFVREGFVIAHFDRMKSPLWVAQRWTKYDFERMTHIIPQERPWKEDLELPQYARGGTSYDGNNTKLDRGHMARHSMNRAWGIDSSNWGCKMSNSAPQHREINRFSSSWRTLEDEIQDIVTKPGTLIEAVWTISGAIYRDKSNPTGETPGQDFQNVVKLPEGEFGVPDATYKIVCWFDENQHFQARAFVFEQPHTATGSGENFNLSFTLGDPKADLTTFLVKIAEIEERTGVDFFTLLEDSIENTIEITDYDNLWGAE